MWLPMKSVRPIHPVFLSSVTSEKNIFDKSSYRHRTAPRLHWRLPTMLKLENRQRRANYRRPSKQRPPNFWVLKVVLVLSKNLEYRILNFEVRCSSGQEALERINIFFCTNSKHSDSILHHSRFLVRYSIFFISSKFVVAHMKT